MIYRMARIASFLALAICANPASAQSVDDVKCILASNIFVKAAKDDKMKHIAEDAAYFYLGRMNRFKPADLRLAINQQKKSLSSANAGAIMNLCARNMAEAGKAFDGITSAVSK